MQISQNVVEEKIQCEWKQTAVLQPDLSILDRIATLCVAK